VAEGGSHGKGHKGKAKGPKKGLKRVTTRSSKSYDGIALSIKEPGFPVGGGGLPVDGIGWSWLRVDGVATLKGRKGRAVQKGGDGETGLPWAAVYLLYVVLYYDDS
jgi:hypothetical protein